jgi:protein required for attachment to host cells
LDKARINHAFDHLIVIAPPHFHGLLNQHLNHHVLNLVTHQIEKDYTKCSVKEIKNYLNELPR